jgi:hypothetical protein
VTGARKGVSGYLLHCKGTQKYLPAHYTPSTCRARPSRHARSVCACVQPPWIGSIIRVCTSHLPDARLPFSRLHDWLFTKGLSLAYVSSRCVERKPTNEPCVKGDGGSHVVVTHALISHHKSTQCVLISIETALQVYHPPLLTTPCPSLLRRRSASASAPPPAPSTSGSTEAGAHTPVFGESVPDSLVRPYSVAESSVEGESSDLASSRDLSGADLRLSGGPARDLRSPVDLANGAPVVVHHHRRVGDSAVRPPEPVRAAAGSHSPRGRLLSRGRGGTVTVRRPGRREQVGDASSSSSSASGALASSLLSRV